MGTKHCCWGECKTDSRYPEKWPESLKELKNSGQKVFIPFPKPWRDLAKCKRWIVACSREFFTEKNVNKNTYICALHWPGGKGHTVEFSDPLKANLTPTQAGRASAPKRKAPKSREEPVTKQKKVINENYGEQSDVSFWSLYRLTIGNYLSLAQPMPSMIVNRQDLTKIK